MSQQGNRTKSFLDFYYKKYRDDSMENVILFSDVEAASSVSSESGRSSNGKQKLLEGFAEEFQTSNQPLSSSALKC